MYLYRFTLFALTVARYAKVNADSSTSQNAKVENCALAGPAFPAPSQLSNSALLSSAISEFDDVLNDKSQGLLPNTTALTVAVFSSTENSTFYERYHTPGIDIGAKKVDRDSIFRIGSVAKVFTVWTLLAAIGDSRFNDPITKYIPELESSETIHGPIYDDIESVRWEEVTLGELASQSAGIARAASGGDLAVQYSRDILEESGFPALNDSDVPKCSADLSQPTCTGEEFFEQLLKRRPTWPSSHSPAYSNLAFTLLAYALEGISGKDLETSMTDMIFKPLAMRHSSYIEAPKSGGVIPGDPSDTAWLADLGLDSPAGSLYMSTGDLVKAGEGILNSAILSPALTRRWLKPRTMTGRLNYAVGAPWEITFLESEDRVIPYYIKDGDLGAYHASFVLSPQHDVGFAILTAGANASQLRTSLKVKVSEIIMPAVEKQARAEAGVNFNGTYYDKITNSSITIAAGHDGYLGLTVQSLVSRGVPLIGPGSSPESPTASDFGIGNNTRLYPTTLRTISPRSDRKGQYDSRLGFRASYLPPATAGAIVDPCIVGWAGLDRIKYGNSAFDDWVFDMSENGTALSVDVRMLRLTLDKKV